MSRRMARVNELLREELSQLILRELKDPRVASFVTITEVDTSSDLDHARVYVSIMASAEEQKDVMKGLKSAEGFLRHTLRERIKMRKIPTLTFSLDTSMERGAQMLELINQVANGHGAPQERRV